MANLLRADLPAPGLLPAAQGFLVGVVLLLGFALPPLLAAEGALPAVRVIRRETGGTSGARVRVLRGRRRRARGAAHVAGGRSRDGGYVIGGFGAAVLVFFAVSWGAAPAHTPRLFP
jgi:putative ABC transport system permease protein